MAIELKGVRFGKLVAKERSRAHGLSSWLCQCDCGNVANVITSNLTASKSRSCGMCTKDLLANHKAEYRIWSGMKSRCDNPDHQAYKHYGARGITYQDSWSHFPNFLRDMGKKPKGLSLDRIDNDGNYTRENCRWATNVEQKNNMRTNRLLTFNGKTQTMAEWAREIGINYRTLKSRLNISKLSVEESLTRPYARNNKSNSRRNGRGAWSGKDDGRRVGQ